MKEAGLDKNKTASFEQQFDHLAGAEHDAQDEDKIRKLQRAKPDPIESFWHYQANGSAVLTTTSLTRRFRLPNSPKPLAEAQHIGIDGHQSRRPLQRLCEGAYGG